MGKKLIYSNEPFKKFRKKKRLKPFSINASIFDPVSGL
jgi:hypothetical protein